MLYTYAWLLVLFVLEALRLLRRVAEHHRAAQHRADVARVAAIKVGRAAGRQGDEHAGTFLAAYNYALSLVGFKRLEEARPLLRRTIPMARRVTGDSSDISIGLRKLYAQSVGCDAAATLDDIREAVTTLEETERTARRVLGRTHPTVGGMEASLRKAQAALRAREESDVCDAMAAMAPGDA